jgi:hypothetical protein
VRDGVQRFFHLNELFGFSAGFVERFVFGNVGHGAIHEIGVFQIGLIGGDSLCPQRFHKNAIPRQLIPARDEQLPVIFELLGCERHRAL